jgi:hypothetical protein
MTVPHAGAQQQQQEPAEAAPESQLALLPVHVHRSPCKRVAQPAAAAFSKRREGGASGCRHSNSSASSSTASLDSVGAAGQAHWQLGQRPRCVPVLSEAQQQPQKEQPGLPQPPLPLPFPAAPGQRAAAGAAAPAGARSCSSSGAEEEEPVCSVCLDSFEDGAKVREGGLPAWQSPQQPTHQQWTAQLAVPVPPHLFRPTTPPSLPPLPPADPEPARLPPQFPRGLHPGLAAPQGHGGHLPQLQGRGVHSGGRVAGPGGNPYSFEPIAAATPATHSHTATNWLLGSSHAAMPISKTPRKFSLSTSASPLPPLIPFPSPLPFSCTTSIPLPALLPIPSCVLPVLALPSTTPFLPFPRVLHLSVHLPSGHFTQ